MEVVVTSECSGQLWNCCVWDPLTGTTLRTFKGGISCSKTLNILAGDYVISSQKDKPILQVDRFSSGSVGNIILTALTLE